MPTSSVSVDPVWATSPVNSAAALLSCGSLSSAFMASVDGRSEFAFHAAIHEGEDADAWTEQEGSRALGRLRHIDDQERLGLYRDLLRRRAEVTEGPAGDTTHASSAGGAGDGRTAPGETICTGRPFGARR